APTVPCHRVVASNLTIGGFAGQTEGTKIREKCELLAAEGVTFSSESTIDRNCQFSFA
ncbi:MAG: MGMT family protein, partial [Verrucomicrobiales bacterium]|nr:MGMT family protein [Verrucomicrobiales bacterium]